MSPVSDGMRARCPPACTSPAAYPRQQLVLLHFVGELVKEHKNQNAHYGLGLERADYLAGCPDVVQWGFSRAHCYKSKLGGDKNQVQHLVH